MSRHASGKIDRQMNRQKTDWQSDIHLLAIHLKSNGMGGIEVKAVYTMVSTSWETWLEMKIVQIHICRNCINYFVTFFKKYYHSFVSDREVSFLHFVYYFKNLHTYIQAMSCHTQTYTHTNTAGSMFTKRLKSGSFFTKLTRLNV